MNYLHLLLASLKILFLQKSPSVFTLTSLLSSLKLGVLTTIYSLLSSEVSTFCIFFFDLTIMIYLTIISGKLLDRQQNFQLCLMQIPLYYHSFYFFIYFQLLSNNVSVSSYSYPQLFHSFLSSNILLHLYLNLQLISFALFIIFTSLQIFLIFLAYIILYFISSSNPTLHHIFFLYNSSEFLISLAS